MSTALTVLSNYVNEVRPPQPLEAYLAALLPTTEEAALANRATVGFLATMSTLIFSYLVKWPDEEVLEALQIWSANGRKLLERFEIDPAPYNTLVTDLAVQEWDQDRWDENLYSIGTSLKALGTGLSFETDIERPHLTLLNHLRIWCTTGSEPSWRNLSAGIPLLHVSSLTKMFSALHDDVAPNRSHGDSAPAGNQDAIALEMMNIVHALTGDRRYMLTKAEADKFNKHRLKGIKSKYAAWHALNKSARTIYERHLKRYIMSHGGSPQPVGEIYRALQSEGLKIIPLHTNFDGLVVKVGVKADGKIGLFTAEDQEIVGAMPAHGDTVKRSKAGVTYIFEVSGPWRKVATRYYTKDHTEITRVDHKFATADSLAAQIDTLSARWEQAIIRPPRNRPKDQVCALLLHLIYEVGARVGSNKKGSNDGITSLRVKNCRVTGNHFRLAYTGKSAVDQDHDYAPVGPVGTAVMALMKKLVKGRDPEDWLFHVDGVRITEKDVNDYFKSIGASVPKGSGVHKLRHVKGNKICRDVLASETFKPSKAALSDPSAAQREAETWFIERVATPVGDALGHRKAGGETNAKTSIGSYIDPSIIREWFETLKKHGVRLPNWKGVVALRVAGE